MKAITGVVMGGRIELPEEFAAEGAQVVVLAPESGEPVVLSPTEERALLEAMEEIRRGDYVDGEDLLSELRSSQSQDTQFGSLPEPILEAASSMGSQELTSVAYYTRIALEHWCTPEDLRKCPLLAGTSIEPSLEEHEIVCQWLAAIEQKENGPIDQLDRDTIHRYTGELSGMALRRAEEERGPIDSERAQRLLENLRRAVPWPPELRKAS